MKCSSKGNDKKRKKLMRDNINNEKKKEHVKKRITKEKKQRVTTSMI